MTITVVTQPASEPVSLTEAKAHLRVDASDEDGLITGLISTVRSMAEVALRRSLVTQTLDACFDHFPGCHADQPARSGAAFELLLPPLVSVTSLTYVDTNGTTQTLPTDQYQVDARSQPARILPAYGYFWPATRQQANAVTVRFVAGYGGPEDVPSCIKSWMLIKLATLYENRESIVVGARASIVQMPDSYIDSLLDPERVTGRTT